MPTPDTPPLRPRGAAIHALAARLGGKVADDGLAALADEPASKGVGGEGVCGVARHQQPGRVEQRVGRVVVGAGLDDGEAGAQVGVEREEGAAVGDGVLAQVDGGAEGLEGEVLELVVPGGDGVCPGDLPCASARWTSLSR